jgi:hypothetical protein
MDRRMDGRLNRGADGHEREQTRWEARGIWVGMEMVKFVPTGWALSVRRCLILGHSRLQSSAVGDALGLSAVTRLHPDMVNAALVSVAMGICASPGALQRGGHPGD